MTRSLNQNSEQRMIRPVEYEKKRSSTPIILNNQSNSENQFSLFLLQSQNIGKEQRHYLSLLFAPIRSPNPIGAFFMLEISQKLEKTAFHRSNLMN